jgi:hypothetical protein
MWEVATMRNLILAALAALALTATIVPVTHAGPSGPYDNTGKGPTFDGGLNGGGG